VTKIPQFEDISSAIEAFVDYFIILREDIQDVSVDNCTASCCISDCSIVKQFERVTALIQQHQQSETKEGIKNNTSTFLGCYKSSNFPALRIRHRSGLINLFASGKVVLLGFRSRLCLEESILALKTVLTV
jgi:hypothetical protein